MSTVRDPDPIVVAWLEAGPRELPEATRRAIALAIGSTAQHRRPIIRAGRRALSRFQVLGIAAVLGATTLIGALAVAGGLGPRPSLPPVTTGATPSPDASSTGIPSMTEPFTSPLFGYTVRYPAGWEAAAAATPWASFVDPRWSDEGDQFINRDPSTAPRRIAVVSATITADLTEQEWIDRYVPVRYERDGMGRLPGRHCPGGNSWLADAPIGSWEIRAIAGREGMVRASCGFVDGVVVAGRRAYVISAEGLAVTWRAGDRTVAVFDAFVATLELHPEEAREEPVASPASSDPDIATFTSRLYGHSLAYPTDWTAKAATEPWSGSDWSSKGTAADVLWPPVPSGEPRLVHLAVKAIAVPGGTTAAAWADANVSRRPELYETAEGGRYCRFGSNSLGSWSDDWRDGTIGGEPARLRAACGFVDAVVVVDGPAFVFSMFTSRAGGADTGPFEDIARTGSFKAG